jgi:hypothetical protein
MPERDPHPDNDIIDQADRSGGNVNRTVGTRAELHSAQGTLEGNEVERAVGSDNPAEDQMKGTKTFDKIRSGNQDR